MNLVTSCLMILANVFVYSPVVLQIQEILIRDGADVISLSLFNYNLSLGQTIATYQRNISQHCWAQHVAYVWPPCCDVLRHVGCCWLKFENGQNRANNTQHVATHHNMVAKRAQHVAPNNVAICCVGMLRSFGRGLKKMYVNIEES